jgi:hypothetical protein
VASLQEKEWVVYAQPPFGGPQQVLRYLARYTHRIAISNGRLIQLENGHVHFSWRDSQDDNAIKEMSLEAVEFIRRFLLHVLPSGFVKIRHCGFLSNRNRKRIIQCCRQLLPPSPAEAFVLTPHQPVCPVCNVGHLHVTDWGRRPMPVTAPCQPVPVFDSSSSDDPGMPHSGPTQTAALRLQGECVRSPHFAPGNLPGGSILRYNPAMAIPSRP